MKGKGKQMRPTRHTQHVFGMCSLLALATLGLRAGGGIDGARMVDASSTIEYILSCQKDNGAFGPLDQEHSDLAWNYPAVRALLLLGEEVPRARECLENGMWAGYREEKAHRTDLYWDLYQKAHLARLLAPKVQGAELTVFPGQRDDGSVIETDQQWALKYLDRDGRYYGPYELSAYHDVASLWYMVSALTELGGSIENSKHLGEFLSERQSADGGFVDAYRVAEPPASSDAHLVVTHHAVSALRALGLPVPQAPSCVEWIRSCQAPSGGFRWNPDRGDHGNKPDVWYTWAAVRALRLLGSEPDDVDSCISWINTLQNADGGFGDRPGWKSRLYSTYYAVEALNLLTGDVKGAIAQKRVAEAPPAVMAPGKYRIYQAHLNSPPLENGSQEAMVEAARAMGLDLVGAKTPDASRARAYAKSRGYPMEIVACPENYHHKVVWHGGHASDHHSNWIIPPEMTEQQRRLFDEADHAGALGLPWTEFREQVIKPALKMGTLVWPGLEHSMVNAYMVYDDGLDGQPGYNAILASNGWPSWDWVRHQPFRERWIGQIPVLVVGDGHKSFSEWQDRPEKLRILYLAESYELPRFLGALKEGRSVCVIRKKEVPSGIVYYGPKAAVDYVKERRAEWQWW